MTTITAPVLTELDLRAGLWTVDKMHSAVIFSIRHLGLSKVRGRFEEFDASLAATESLAASRISASINLASINTNNTDRDHHLRSSDFFSVDTNPTMEFVSTGITGADDDWTLNGDLTLNGVTRPVSLAVEYNGVQTNPNSGQLHAGFTATGTIKRSEFGIRFGLAAIGVDKLALSDDVKIELDLQFVEPAA